MADETKVIIITTNEDIIRQFTLNKTTNTHIIDLDNEFEFSCWIISTRSYLK